jgi:hypothetical protein
MRIIPHEQRTKCWYDARRGNPTASSFSKLITSTGKRAASADAYIDELVAEKITGESKFIPTTAAMQHGIDTEPEARDLYSFLRDVEVIEIGLCLHDSIDAGASPDGLVGDDGLLEVKCPQPHTMVKYLRENRLPPEYRAQVMGQLWICEREWCDFLAYHPKMKPLLIRVERDEEFISALAEIVTEAVESIDANFKQLRK